MFEYLFEEADNIEMDVQVGPDKEVEVEANPEEAIPKMSPIDMIKCDPKNVPVACKTSETGKMTCDGEKEACKEFYVDASDVAKYAELTEQTMLSALNSIIAANEGSEMRADNMVVVLGESTMSYARNLEKHGAAYIVVKEADEEAAADNIEIDVQVGPSDDMEVHADPQEANPVDAVKREYDNVIVAKQDDKFFMDVEDVQKCADLNCESVVATLNNIIKVHEADADICADNIALICNESTSDETLSYLENAGVKYFFNEAELTIKAGEFSWKRWKKAILIELNKVVGKMKGDKQASKKAIESHIKDADELIEKIDKEIENVKANPDVEVAYVNRTMKYLAVYAISLSLIGMAFVPEKIIKKVVEGIGLGIFATGAATTIASFDKQGIVKPYLQYLNSVREDVVQEKANLEKELEKVNSKEENK